MSSTGERIRSNARFLRRRAWAISLGFTALGAALVVPWFNDPISWASLIVVLVSWPMNYVAVRLAARTIPRMLFPEEG